MRQSPLSATAAAARLTGRSLRAGFRDRERGGDLQIAGSSGGLETATPLSGPARQRGGDLQIAGPHGGLETATPLPGSAQQRGGDLQIAGFRTHYFDQHAEVRIHGSRLPHWDQIGTLCFVTFRLADSLPSEKLAGFLERRNIWMSIHPRPWDESTTAEYASEFGDKLETWLDAGYGSRILDNVACRRVVEDSISHFDGDRYALHAYVVMPNHVHVLFAPAPGCDVSAIVKSWKSFSARKINRIRGSAGQLWQKEYWDTFIRNAKHHRRVLDYIVENDSRLARVLIDARGSAAGGLETATPLSGPARQRGGDLQIAGSFGGLETASPLADAHLI